MQLGLSGAWSASDSAPWVLLGEAVHGEATYPSKSSLSCSQKLLMLAQFSSLFRGFVALSAGGEGGQCGPGSPRTERRCPNAEQMSP